MRLTKRCLDLFKLLRAARWLTTAQIHRRFFRTASLDAARKRLRKLTEAGHLVVVRQNRLSECWFTLGKEGKRILEADLGGEISLERALPKQCEHLLGINDVRIAAELASKLSYFFACWELPGLGWDHVVIPDAVFSLGGKNVVLEYDRGFENTQFFVTTKMAAYRQGLSGLPLSKILVASDSPARLNALRRAVGDERVVYTTIGVIRQEGLPRSLNG